MSAVLYFFADTSRWFVDWKGTMYAHQKPADLNLFLRSMPLRVVDGSRWAGSTGAGGYVVAADAKDTGYRADFFRASGELHESETIAIDASVLVDAEWQFGAYPDGWIESEAALAIAGAETIQLGLYLPSVAGLGSKPMTLRIGGTPVYDIALPRGDGIVTPVFELDPLRRAELTLTTTAEPSNPADMRELGVLVFEVKANGALCRTSIARQ
ncbi:hypothetical protein [Sphingomonas hengshuiensis]|uniref:Uncharacterized protein n=1 Tax=Sphingomonas hengshuiensis TaxID=1609977 RepID=A0A7U4J9E9_9SPHN|nr:hypothetical protein [Sphingomonas hengshuiensis]AJP72607.1 hypothetical protein TS85_13750 [Sphingomonas hengshuiensis]